MGSELDLRSKGRCRLARSSRGIGGLSGHADHRCCTSSPKREDRIVLIRHRLVGDKALGYRLLSTGRMPGGLPAWAGVRRAYTSTSL